MRQLVRQLAVVFFSAILSLARGLVAPPTTPRCSSTGLDCCPRADEEPRLRSCPARRLVVMMSTAASDPDATRDPDESAEQVSLDRPDVDEDSIEANRISAEGVMRVRERARLRTKGVSQRVWSKSTERQGPEQRHVPRPPTPEQVEAANALFETMLRGKHSDLPRSIKRGMGRWEEDGDDGFGEGLDKVMDEDDEQGHSDRVRA